MIYAFADCEVDTNLYELRRDRIARAIEPQVYDVLVYLIENRLRLVSKAELLDRLWPDRMVSEAALSHCIMAARKAIGDNGQTQALIRTVHRRGYRFVGEIHLHTQRERRDSRPLPLA